MPSKEHEQKIEEIDREIKSRGMHWKTKKNYPIWLHKENSWGQIDLVGFKREEPMSPAMIDAFEIEERNSAGQISRNLEKLEQIKKMTPINIKVRTCQLKSNEDHKKVCIRK
ncbi:MAG TPA: hypothetical protein P5277_04395 [Candidatus Paceibacterota bacterium]|nr:hypothetical protein [Candidatus Paceibacterota bacterium]